MSNELPILNQISIPKPCHASWDEMTGDQQSRHCAQCEKSVHHLSNMTASEAARVVTQSGGDLCVRGAFRPDGSLITRATLSERVGRTCRRILATTVALPMVVFLPGCSKENLPGPIGDWLGREPEVHSPAMGDMVIMGDVEMVRTSVPTGAISQEGEDSAGQVPADAQVP